MEQKEKYTILEVKKDINIRIIMSNFAPETEKTE